MIQKCAEKSTENFICKLCDYKTSRRSQYNRHLLTQKHKNNGIQFANPIIGR